MAPSQTKAVTIGGQRQQVVAWNMSTSGIYENFSGERPNVCIGQTIFGMTSTTGSSDILDINFVTSVDDYISHATAIRDIRQDSSQPAGYDLGGRKMGKQGKGVSIVGGKKVLL